MSHRKEPQSLSFVNRQRAQQEKFIADNALEDFLRRDSRYWLRADSRSRLLSPAIASAANAYFGPPRRLQWHRFASHALSSQVCCVNFLMSLSDKPDVLSEVIGRAVGRTGLKMLPLEGGQHYVGFEWIGKQNYLCEWPKNREATRGANVTSADAVVRFEHEGRAETLLIEWKYSETYGSPPDRARAEERVRRYQDKAFYPNGPIRDDLGLTVTDLFWEPFYQMFRQQMLAWQMQQEREDGAERVSVLHLSPRGNTALHKVTAPALKKHGTDAFEVFKTLLVRPEDFTSAYIEDVFGPALEQHRSEPWAAYLLDRYRFLTDPPSGEA